MERAGSPVEGATGKNKKKNDVTIFTHKGGGQLCLQSVAVIVHGLVLGRMLLLPRCLPNCCCCCLHAKNYFGLRSAPSSIRMHCCCFVRLYSLELVRIGRVSAPCVKKHASVAPPPQPRVMRKVARSLLQSIANSFSRRRGGGRQSAENDGGWNEN